VVYGRDGGYDTAVNLTDIASGEGGFKLFGDSASDKAGQSVSGAGDVNGDGFADLIVGAPYDDNDGGTDAGAAYIFHGGDYDQSVDQQGTAVNDILTGSAADESMVGGRGNDILDSNGGADVLYGGAGNDSFLVDDPGFFRLDGGSGEDTLEMDGDLDLTSIANNKVENIEAIDITGSGDNELSLGLHDVLDCTDGDNELKILGDSGDSVSLTDGTWTHTGTSDGFDTYTCSTASLLVDSDIDLTLP
jgi:hypothetical protein